MIVTCPACGKRYRIDEARLSEGRRRLRCAGCGQVFAAEPSGASQGPRAPGPTGPPGGHGPGESPLVLVGDEDREFRDLLRKTLEALGARVEATDDGEAAFRFAVAKHPTLMVLNVYLRKLLGVAVCEGVKGSPDLRGTRVALVGSVFKSERFVRGPRTLYGADDYFEDVISQPELRERLRRLLQGEAPSGVPRPTASASAAERGGEAAAPIGAGARAAGRARREDAVAGSPGLSDEPPIEPRAEIRRLARIMLSDLKIYYPDRFQRAVAERRFFETFKEELTKGKELIVNRFPTLKERVELLAAALREGLEQERVTGGERAARHRA